MKKYLFLALGVAALTSCSSDEVTELNQGNEIKFSVVADNDSRAADVWCNNNLMPNFLLYADAKSAQDTYKAFINEETYTRSGVTTDYNAPNGITRYWPENDALNFYAIYGIDAANMSWSAGSGPISSAYTVNSNVQSQVDIVYAIKPNKKKNDADVVDGKVALNFRHALSQIEFMAKNMNPDELRIEILDVRVGNVNSVGTLTLPTEESTDQNVQNHPTDNGIAFAPQENLWSNLGTLANFDVTETLFGSPKTLTAEAQSLTISTDADTQGDAKNNSMLLLPQTQTAWDGDAGAFLAVKCNIYNKVTVDGSVVEVLLYGDKNNDGVGEGRWAYVPADINWEPGYKYVYTFSFADGTNAGFDDSGDEEGKPSNTPVLVKLNVSVTVDDFEPKDPANTPMEVTPFDLNP